MKLFISWSGERSKKVGELLYSLVGGTIQRIRPWISSEMDRGTIWFNEIGNELRDVADGIVCLTRENLTAPWILFEAGALARGLTSQRIYTFLIDLEPNDISPPLSQFNHTTAAKDDIFRLLKTLNSRLAEDALSEKILEREFELHWPSFVEQLNEVIKSIPAAPLPQKKEKDILLEIQSSIRGIERSLRPSKSNDELSYMAHPFFPDNPPSDESIRRKIVSAKQDIMGHRYRTAQIKLKSTLAYAEEFDMQDKIDEINDLLNIIENRMAEEIRSD